MPGRPTFLETHGVPELLAPAGGPEPFNAALAAGADAIYCGVGNDFNARRGAKNFDDESFAAACRRAHVAGARVYVTVNVAVSTAELPRVLELVRRTWLLGADAFIIPDWGLLAEVRRRWPQIETHVSTQANVHDARGVAWCRDAWGVDRVTLSRELSLAEIARIVHVGLRGDVHLHLRPPAADLRHEAPVLDDEGVRAELPRAAHEPQHARHLLGGDGHVHGHVDARPGKVRAAAGRGEGLVVEVARPAPGVEVVAQAAVDGVGPRRERGVEGLGAARRRQQLRHAESLKERGSF